MENPTPDNSAAHLKGATGLRRIWNALFYSLAGLSAAYRHESAFRQEIWLATLLIPLAAWLADDGVQAALLIGSILLVLITELLNSGVEAIVDKASPEVHELAGRAKDIGSAAVLISLLNATVVWGLVLYHVYGPATRL